MKKIFAVMLAVVMLLGSAAFAQETVSSDAQNLTAAADNTVNSIINNRINLPETTANPAETASQDADAQPAVILTEAGEEWIAPIDGENVTIEKDLGFVVNGVYYQVYSPVEPLLAALGEPMEIISSPSCVFVGEDFEYDYAFGSIFTSPIEGNNIWYEFYIFEVGMVTTRGLTIGDPASKIVEKYGENYYSEGDGMYTYSLSGNPEDYASPCLIFETAEDEVSGETVVISIDVYYPTNVN